MKTNNAIKDATSTDQLSRRRFTSRVLQTVSAVSTLGCLSTGYHVQAQEKTDKPVVFCDVHVHITQPYNRLGELNEKMMLEWMDNHNVEKACVLPLVSPESWFYPISVDYVLEHTKNHRDRLIPFCAIDPRTINLGGQKGIVDLLKRFVDAGAKGFGEHKWGGPIDDPRNMTLFKACGEVGLPVLFHLDNNRNTDKPGLPGLEKVLKTFPETTFIGHANGWWASISGDATQANLGQYPKTPVKPGGAIDRLMEKYPNIYGDLSAGSGANALSRDMEHARKFVIRRADRLLFGSDYLHKAQKIPQFSILNQLKLPREVQQKVYAGNLKRILKLS